MPDPGNPQPGPPSPTGELARLFLKLGVIGFGGPAAHVALMRDEVVRRRRWLDDRQFMELVGATNLIPGPNSTELAIHLGQQRGRGRGMLVAGACFILPAVLIVSALAWAYQRYGTDPAVVDLRYGILPVIIAVVAHAVFGMGRSTLVSPLATGAAVAAFGAYLLGVNELAVLAAAGAAAALWTARGRLRPHDGPVALLMPLAGVGGSDALPVSLWRLGAVFLEIGAVLYGSGYVLLAFLRANLVDSYGWLTDQQLLDAVAVGQVTPGPLFTTATFVGWQVAGVAGAAVATLAIFAPSFGFVALLGRIVPWMRVRPAAHAFLTGVTAASLGLMAGVLVRLMGEALVDPFTIGIAAAALGLLVRTPVSSAWLVAGGLVVGLGRIVAG